MSAEQVSRWLYEHQDAVREAIGVLHDPKVRWAQNVLEANKRYCQLRAQMGVAVRPPVQATFPWLDGVTIQCK